MDNLIPRFTTGTREFNTLLPLFAPEPLMAYVFMGEPAWNVMVTNQWKRDLEEGMCYAFARGVAGMVSNVYRVPMNNVLPSEQPSSSSTSASPDVSFVYTDKSSDDFSPSDGDHEKDDSQFCPEIDDMMTPKLRQLFRSAHASGTSQLRIRLELTPKQAYFHRLCGLPYVKRDHLEDQPDLLTNAFTNKEGRLEADSSTLYQFMYENAARNMLRYGKLETSLSAEALIVCDEIFCVWDAETGQVLQGRDSTTPREVAHVVTFERVCQTDEGASFPFLPQILHLSNWQIADIDDLLGPRKWFHVVVPEPEKDNFDEPTESN